MLQLNLHGLRKVAKIFCYNNLLAVALDEDNMLQGLGPLLTSERVIGVPQLSSCSFAFCILDEMQGCIPSQQCLLHIRWKIITRENHPPDLDASRSRKE